MRSFDYMKLRGRQWSSDILGLVAGIREYRGRQDTILDFDSLTYERLTYVARVHSIASSNDIEGIRTTAERLDALCEKSVLPATHDEQEIAGYRDVLATINESYEYISLEPRFILQLHRDLFRHSTRMIGGQFKPVQNYIVRTGADGTQTVLFTPPEPFEVPSMLDEACKSFKQAIEAQVADPLILIPAFINDFLCIHPFADGNGRMSRLLTSLLLLQSGFHIGRYISLEEEIDRTKESYYDALQASENGWSDGENDCDPFIRYLLGTIIAAYREFDRHASVIRASAGNPVRQVEEEMPGFYGRFTKRQLAERCPALSVSTVEAVLHKLVSDGAVSKHGQGKGTYYTTNPQ